MKPATPFLAAAERYRSPVTELLGDSMAWYAGFPKTYLLLQTKAEAT